MALHGAVAKKNGESGKRGNRRRCQDPVVGISDLLVHLAQKQQQKTAAEVIEGENLNVLIGSIPLEAEEEEPVKAQILAILKEKYGYGRGRLPFRRI